MIKIEANDGKYLVVDFEGILTKTEEEVIAWGFMGKSTEATAAITNKKPETVKKQKSKSYEKTEVVGSDNPLVSLMALAFHQGFARFVVFFLCAVCLFPALRSNARTTPQMRISFMSRPARFEAAFA